MQLDQGMKELIAIGAAVAANCQSCLTYWVGKSRDRGTSAGKIAEAIEVGKAVREGAAAKLSQEAALLIEGSSPEAGLQGAQCSCDKAPPR